MLSLSTGGALTEYCNGPRSDIATLDKKKKIIKERKTCSTELIYSLQ